MRSHIRSQQPDRISKRSLCLAACIRIGPLADIDSLILSNMHILGNWENDAPLAALAETPEPAAKPEQLAESPKQVFGLDGDRFKISVPEGWSAEAIHGGVRIVAGNGRSTLTAAILQTGGQSAEQIARNVARSTGLRFSSQDADGTCFLSGHCDGMRTIATSSVEDGKWIFMAVQGEDEETLAKTLDSIEQAG